MNLFLRKQKMKVIARIFLWIMKIRYKVEVKNFPTIDNDSNYLVLPNHIAYVDPVLLRCIFRPYINIRPVVTSDFSNNPFL
jgi:1-acyl-sn-glycerol-3-phosphate acyltransferase